MNLESNTKPKRLGTQITTSFPIIIFVKWNKNKNKFSFPYLREVKNLPITECVKCASVLVIAHNLSHPHQRNERTNTFQRDPSLFFAFFIFCFFVYVFSSNLKCSTDIFSFSFYLSFRAFSSNTQNNNNTFKCPIASYVFDRILSSII